MGPCTSPFLFFQWNLNCVNNLNVVKGIKLKPMKMNVARMDQTILYMIPMGSWKVQSLCPKGRGEVILGLGSDQYQRGQLSQAGSSRSTEVGSGMLSSMDRDHLEPSVLISGGMDSRLQESYP